MAEALQGARQAVQSMDWSWQFRPEPTAKKVTKSYFTFIATDNLAPLHALVRKATAQFRYEPLLSYEDVNALHPSLLVFPGRQALLNRSTPQH
jgi:hypothetical protein